MLDALMIEFGANMNKNMYILCDRFNKALTQAGLHALAEFVEAQNLAASLMEEKYNLLLAREEPLVKDCDGEILLPKLNGSCMAIIKLLKGKKRGLNSQDIANRLGLSVRGVRVNLLLLTQQGFVEQKGKGLNDPTRRHFLKEK